jgi:hypothetical protein
MNAVRGAEGTREELHGLLRQAGVDRHSQMCGTSAHPSSRENPPEPTKTGHNRVKPVLDSGESRIVQKFVRGKNTKYRPSRKDCLTLATEQFGCRFNTRVTTMDKARVAAMRRGRLRRRKSRLHRNCRAVDCNVEQDCFNLLLRCTCGRLARGCKHGGRWCCGAVVFVDNVVATCLWHCPC